MIKITIKTDTEAFVCDYDKEVARILSNIANDIAQGDICATYNDINGKLVCKVEFEQD